MTNSVLEIKNLTKTYGSHRGVEDVSLQVNEGEIFGFLGPNGRGKSTTIRCVLGLIGYKQGEIKILGLDAVKSREKILQNVGFMPSEPMFYPDMRAGQVIKMAADARGRDCARRARELCKRLNLDPRRKIRELSLGNRKKVSIVCAAQHRPRLYILDEPTSGLDPLVQAEFFRIIRERVSRGASCILSTHILPEVKKYCHRVAMMREGRLIYTGSVAEISKSSAKRIKITRDGESLDYLYKGDLKDLYKELQGGDITDISVEEPSLEEIFMHYYK